MDLSPNDVRYEPLPRWGHTSVAIGDKVYMWGGCIDDFTEESKKQLSSQVEVFDTHTELWSQMPTTGTPPNGLYNCAYTAVGDKMYVYGGWDGHASHSTLHCLDTKSLKWEELRSSDSSEAPMKMSGCGMVAYGNHKLVLFGGYGVPLQANQNVPGVSYARKKKHVSGAGIDKAGDTSKSGEGAGDDKAGDASKSGGGIESGSEEEEEEEEEEMKRWTNQLKVYNTSDGTWSSPAATGECPPPCVDFSYTKVNEYKALVYGGFQPETGTVSDAYILNMETWHWHKLGSDTESTTSLLSPTWPKGRDGHASCVLSEQPHPQVLISGGWDKHNKLLHDAWILDINTGTWTELSGLSNPSVIGPRFWHSVVSFVYSQRLRQLVFFGGCPCAPVESNDSTEGVSWAKLAATVMIEVGRMEPLSLFGNRSSYVDVFSAADENGGGEWVVLDAVDHSQLGHPLRRMREKVVFAEYRANRAEAIARDTIRRMEVMSFRRSVTPLRGSEILATTCSPDNDIPFWVVPRQEVELTTSEIGRGKWAVVKMARFRGENVAARCLTNPILSEDNRKIFIECMDMAAKMHHHPNLLPFYGVVLEGEPIILTELMPTNLRVVSEKSQLLYYQVVGIALDVANALKFLHSMKPDPVVHGDLSCTNVLLVESKGNMWKAKISDYMTAKFFQQLMSNVPPSPFSPHKEFSFSPTRGSSFSPPRSDDARGSSPGTPKYSREKNTKRKESLIAPDILNPSNLTVERDIYCYGLVLVEMSTGSLPLEVSLSFLIESICWPDINGLVRECMNYNPNGRPTMEEIVVRMTKLSHAVSIRSGRP